MAREFIIPGRVRRRVRDECIIAISFVHASQNRPTSVSVHENERRFTFGYEECLHFEQRPLSSHPLLFPVVLSSFSFKRQLSSVLSAVDERFLELLVDSSAGRSSASRVEIGGNAATRFAGSSKRVNLDEVARSRTRV